MNRRFTSKNKSIDKSTLINKSSTPINKST